MVDWVAHYDAVYTALAVTATLTPASSPGPTTVWAMDKTKGVEVSGLSQIGVQTVEPAAAIRMTELADNSIAYDDLDGGTITLNGRTWKIISHQPRPAPTGEDGGEVYLFLSEQ